MEHVGIDVHKNQSQICILTSEGELIEKRILTQRGRFAAVFGDRPRARILIEAATESEWVARCLEELGHEVGNGENLSLSSLEMVLLHEQLEDTFDVRISAADARPERFDSLSSLVELIGRLQESTP